MGGGGECLNAEIKMETTLINAPLSNKLWPVLLNLTIGGLVEVKVALIFKNIQ